MGRPITKPKRYRDGFYIEVKNKGEKSGIILVRNTKEEMLKAIDLYSRTKDISILGESRNGKWIEQEV